MNYSNGGVNYSARGERDYSSGGVNYSTRGEMKRGSGKGTKVYLVQQVPCRRKNGKSARPKKFKVVKCCK